MLIHVHLAPDLEDRTATTARAMQVVGDALRHVAGHITTVEVSLSDVNGPRTGADDKRCMIEARIEGIQPIAVTDHGPTLDQVIDSGAAKLGRLIERTLGRRQDLASHRTDA